MLGPGQRFPIVFNFLPKWWAFAFFCCMAGDAMRGGQKGLGTGLEVRSRYRTWKRMGKGTSQELDWNKQDIDTVYVLYVYIYDMIYIIYIYLNNVYLQLLLCFPYTLSLPQKLCVLKGRFSAFRSRRQILRKWPVHPPQSSFWMRRLWIKNADQKLGSGEQWNKKPVG